MRSLDRRRRRLVLSGALALTLAACSGAPRPSALPPSPETGPPDDVIRSWRATGKIVARVEDRGRRWGASLDWRQKREDFRIRLSGPLGRGALQVKGHPGEVELRTAKGERRSAPTTSELLSEELGLDLPAESLRHWVTARVRPGVPVEDWTLDDAGRLATLVQQGWRIGYEYGAASRSSLPDHVTLNGEGIELRIAIRNWRVD